MRCEDVRDRLLDPEVEPHLGTCPACRADAARLRRTWALLDALPGGEPDTAVMRRRLDRLIADHEPRRWRPWLRTAALLAASAAVTAIGVTALRPSTGRDPQLTLLRRELAEVRTLLTISLLQQTAAGERLNGVQTGATLVATEPAVVGALLDALRHDPDVNVRLATIRALERVGTETTVRDAVVAALDREESPLVSIALVDFVVAARLPPAVPALRRVAGNPERDGAVRDAAEAAIARLLEGDR